jgi:hypothetical protein
VYVFRTLGNNILKFYLEKHEDNYTNENCKETVNDITSISTLMVECWYTDKYKVNRKE